MRYRLLETIRLFAAERLAEADGQEVAAVAGTHCAHFLAVADAAAAHLTGPEQGSWLARLDADQANLRRAAEHSAGRPDGTALVLRLGVALDRYWRARSRLQEAFGLLVPVLRRPDARANPALFAAALVTATWAACWINIATARHLAEQAVQVARQLGDDRLLIRSLAALCDAYFWAGEPDIGRPFGQEAVERARGLGDERPEFSTTRPTNLRWVSIHDYPGHLRAQPDAAVGGIRTLERQFAHGGVADFSSLRAWVAWVRV